METASTPDLWQQALELYRAKIDDNNFSTWLKPTRFHSFEDDNLFVAVPSYYFEHWLVSNYSEELTRILNALAKRRVQLNFIVDGDGAEEALPLEKEMLPPSAGELRDVHLDGSAINLRFLGNKLNGNYVFETFVVGEHNRFAHAAAKAVSDPNSRAFNPLFLYGGSGLGKTHLMQAIGHEFRGSHPALKTLYVTSEQFVASFIDSITNKRLFDFRDLFRNVDLLMIDDIQFLAGKEQTQIEFFHTFNDLHNDGKKIVISSDRPPKELGALEERLRSRFEWGLTVDIQVPNLETRVAILQKKAQMELIPLTDDVALFIAEIIVSNIRELEGALHRLKIYSRLHNRPIDLELTREVIGFLLNDGHERRIGTELIMDAVCSYFQVTHQDLVGNVRQKKFTAPRHIAMYLMRELTDMSFKDIANQFGGRDHSSVIYAIQKIKADLETSSSLKNSINFLIKNIRDNT